MRINGNEQKLEKQITLAQYLEEEGYHSKEVAVERNGEIVPKARFEETLLTDADRLEIVHFVGGG